ncbi:hypothetical protein HKX48_005249 [Thoreauomyces humboldtii]|nr:hypothetical protein HKX48_005249 [Thoreauomyces humboldtii]
MSSLVNLACAFLVAVSLVPASHAVPARLGLAIYGQPALAVFGDSWSDTGNTFHLTNQTWPATPPYFEGHFSNGPVWSEGAILNTRTRLSTFAYGGATTSNKLVQGYTGANSTILVPSVDEQVATYLTGSGTAIHETTHAFWAGGNDAFFAFLGGLNVTGVDVALSIVDSVNKVAAAGGTKFVVFKLPALQNIPYFNDPTTIAYKPFFANFTVAFNAALIAEAAKNKAIKVFHTDSFIADLRIKGVTDRTHLCLNLANNTECASPNSHLYWDQFHFTKPVHAAIGHAFQKYLQLAHSALVEPIHNIIA